MEPQPLPPGLWDALLAASRDDVFLYAYLDSWQHGRGSFVEAMVRAAVDLSKERARLLKIAEDAVACHPFEVRIEAPSNDDNDFTREFMAGVDYACKRIGRYLRELAVLRQVGGPGLEDLIAELEAELDEARQFILKKSKP